MQTLSLIIAEGSMKNDADTDVSMQTRVYTTPDRRVIIEQSSSSIVLSSEQILSIINQLHVCYDYCAAWKE